MGRRLDLQNYTFRSGRAYSPARMVNEIATPLGEPPSTESVSVFSSVRQVDQPPLALPPGLTFDCRLQMEGLGFLGLLPSNHVLDMFLGSQYRSAAT